jgi:hypothetical protein
MTEERRALLEKIHKQIKSRISELIEDVPDIHTIDDGIIVRFFVDWDECIDKNGIRYKILNSVDDPDESVVFFFLPENAEFKLLQRFYIGAMTCLSGEMEVTVGDEIKTLKGYSKIVVNSDDVGGKALKNTYLLTTSNRRDWSEETYKHVKEICR